MTARQDFFRSKHQIDQRWMITAVMSGHLLSFDAKFINEAGDAAPNWSRGCFAMVTAMTSVSDS